MMKYLQIKICPYQSLPNKDWYGQIRLDRLVWTDFYQQIFHHFLIFGFITIIIVILALLSLTDEP